MSEGQDATSCQPGEGRPTLSIRARLLVLAGIVLLPLMVDRIRGIEADRGERITTAHQQVLALVRQGIDGQRDIIVSARAVLQVAARAHSAVAPAPDACDRLLSDIAHQVAWIKTFSVADPDGRIVCSSNPQAVGVDISDRVYFQQAVRTGQYVLSDYAVGRLNAVPMLVALYPLYRPDGSLASVLVGVLNSVWISRLAGTVSEGTRRAVLMVDGTGAVLTHHPDPGNWAGRDFKSHPLVRTMLARPEGVAIENGLDEVRRVFGFVQLPGTKSRLAIGLDEREVLSRVDREMRYAYLELAIIATILVLAIWIGGNRLIVRPIRMLAHMAERFGRGEYEMHARRRRWAAEFTPLVTALDEMAAKILARRNETRMLTARLNELAITDELSGLPNRRAFDTALATEWERARTRGEAVALAMIDVDHFKSFNDRYGHVRGDACLRVVGEVLSGAVQTDLDLPARYGGEEFALLLPAMDLITALRVAERLRNAIEERHLPHDTAPSGIVTVSIGIASLRPAPNQGPWVLVEAADAALYGAKRRGRNTVVTYEAVAHEAVEFLAAG